MNKKYGVWAAAACTAMVVGLSGCGSSDKDDKGGKTGGNTVEKPAATSGVEKLSAQQISDKAKAELIKVKSMRMNVTGTDGGQPMKLDLALDSAGNCRGSMTSGTAGSFELVKMGEKVWMKPDDAFWKTQLGPQKGAEGAKLFSGKWLHGSTSDPQLKDMAEMCNLKAMQAKAAADTDNNHFTKGTPVTQGGQQVIPLNGKTEKGAPLTLYVAITGKPYPVKIVESGKDASTTELSDYDKPVSTDTPSDAESIDVAKLQQELGS
ncbi:hypothetical protein ACZ90_31545 [Streptomyces albus subsp. albus]|nr:hypothetical protein ACZ90_31545 [Streptomyces albus subsp. albus]